MVAEPRWMNFVASCRRRRLPPRSASSSASRSALFCSAPMTVPSRGVTLKRCAAAVLLPAPGMLVTPMKPRAFSYLRMSSQAQLSGDSLRRQLAAAREWADRNGLDLQEDDQL